MQTASITLLNENCFLTFAKNLKNLMPQFAGLLEHVVHNEVRERLQGVSYLHSDNCYYYYMGFIRSFSVSANKSEY